MPARVHVRYMYCMYMYVYVCVCIYIYIYTHTHAQVGDILLKVDGSEVHSTEDASKLILGERGTKIAMLFKRFEENEKGEGKIRKFTVHLVRGTASGGG